MHLLTTTATSARRSRRAGRSRPAAGRHRGAVVRRQRSRRARRRLGGRARGAAEPAARAICATCATRCRSICGSSGSAGHAKVILVRLLGGLDWWRYGVEQLTAMARTHGIALAVLPGEDRDDPRLAAASTLPPAELARCSLSSARAGARTCARCCAASPAMPARRSRLREPQPLPRMAGYLAEAGAVDSSS